VTGSLPQARLDELWNFDDASESERRFRAELTTVPAGSEIAAELTTQLARALGLQDRFAEADVLLDSVDGGSGVVLARALLERGRLRNSAGPGGNQGAGLAELELAADAARDFGTPRQQQWAQEAIDEARATVSKLAD
jgi:hypothetical protein